MQFLYTHPQIAFIYYLSMNSLKFLLLYIFLHIDYQKLFLFNNANCTTNAFFDSIASSIRKQFY